MSRVAEGARSLALGSSVLESKLQPYPAPPGTVSRTALVNRLRAASPAAVLVVAPAGFGKTTLLQQWLERDGRPGAWVSVDEEDNDPELFARCVATALDRALDGELFTSGDPTEDRTLPELARTLTSVEQPLAVVLDGVDVLGDRGSLRTVSVLADHLPQGSTLALAGRRSPMLPVARWRAAGRIFELGPSELAMSLREARAMFRGLGVAREDERLADELARTEGWPVGLYLAALAFESCGDDEEAGRARHERFVSDYVRLEVLSTLSETDVSFVTRASVLTRLCPPLCAAVVGTGSAKRGLEGIDRQSQLVVPLDRPGQWYRISRPVREVLRAELDRREPELAPVLQRRAADWYEARGLPEEAVDYALAAGDRDRAARLVSSVWFHALDGGRMATVSRWLGWLDDDETLARFPTLGVAGAWVHALTGGRDEAESWLEAATRTRARGRGAAGNASIEALAALVRAVMCRDGVTAMRADAELAVSSLPPRSPYRPTASLLLAVSHLLTGEVDAAEAILAAVAGQSRLPGGAVAAALALGEQALIATAHDSHAQAEALVRRAGEVTGAGGASGYVTSAPIHAAAAHVALRQGDLASLRSELARATELVSRAGQAIPWLAVQTRIEVARVQLAVADAVGAGTTIAELDALLRYRPSLGTLVDDVRRLRSRLTAAQSGNGHPVASLTAAELRLIPLLSTHLSFREIAQRLFVSRNTVKTQAISVYRKLGVSSRSEAIARAADLGLIDGPA